jgi:nitrile hydratase accessory protein
MSEVADVSEAVAQTEGLPRRNGELVFAAPWEARAFGVAVALCREQGLDWDEFRGRLIDEIGAWEAVHGTVEPATEDAAWSYYERWLAALERLVVERSLVTSDELEARTAEIAHATAHEHDHDHDHDRHHHHHHHH